MKRLSIYIMILLGIAAFSSCTEDYDPDGTLVPALSDSGSNPTHPTYTEPEEENLNPEVQDYPQDSDLDKEGGNSSIEKDEYGSDSDLDKEGGNSSIEKDEYGSDSDLDNAVSTSVEGMTKDEYPQDNDLDK